jgi:hypothetical protein
VPASITIPAGSTSGNFRLHTSPVPFALNSSVEAVGATAATLNLKTAGVRMTNLVERKHGDGGANVTGTVSFSGLRNACSVDERGDGQADGGKTVRQWGWRRSSWCPSAHRA